MKKNNKTNSKEIDSVSAGYSDELMHDYNRNVEYHGFMNRSVSFDYNTMGY